MSISVGTALFVLRRSQHLGRASTKDLRLWKQRMGLLYECVQLKNHLLKMEHREMRRNTRSLNAKLKD